MRKSIKFMLYIAPIICCVCYGGGYIAQFIKNYAEWQQAGGRFGSGSNPVFPSFTVEKCAEALLAMPYGIYGVLLCAGFFAVLVFMIMKMGDGDASERDRERNFDYSNKGTYGTSGFM